MALVYKRTFVPTTAGGEVLLSSGPGDDKIMIALSESNRQHQAVGLLTIDDARRLGRELLQHAARLTLAAGRNLTGGPGRSAVDTDGSTG